MKSSAILNGVYLNLTYCSMRSHVKLVFHLVEANDSM